MAAVTIGAKDAPFRGGRWGSVLSTGQLWVMGVSTGAVGSLFFFYSNDGGGTWTEDTGAEITEGIESDLNQNASLFVDVDDNMWLVYRTQSNALRITRGSVSGDAITWTNEETDSNIDGSLNAVDIIAFREGATDIRVVWAVEQGTSSADDQIEVYHARYRTSLATSTQLTNETVYAQYFHLDFNHTGDGKTVQGGSPHLWLAGLDQANGDLYCTRYVWTAGPLWSKSTARLISTDTTFNNILSNTFGFWDGSRFVCGAMSDDPFVFERDAGDTTTTDRSPTLTGHKAGIGHADAYYDQTTEDVYLLIQTTANHPVYARYDRAANAWDSAVTIIEAEARVETSWLYNEGGAKGNQLLPLWRAGSNLRTEKGVITFNTDPTTPIIDAPTSNTTQDVAVTLLVDWTFTDPDPGDTQSAYTLRRDIGGTIEYWNGTTWQATEDATTKIATATTSQTLATSWGADADVNHKYAVKTWDAADAGPSPWSIEVIVTPSAKDNPSISDPTLDQVLATATYTVVWTVATQTKKRTRVYGNNGGVPDTSDIQYDSGILIDGVKSHAASFPTEGVQHAAVTTWNDEGLESTEDTQRVTVTYDKPPVPTLVTTADSPTGAIDVDITNPAPGGGEVATDYNDIYRRIVGTSGAGIRIAIQIAEDGSFDDWAVASGVAYEYLARAFNNTNGTSTDSAWTS